MMLQCRSMEVRADYHQFYLWDAGMDPEAPEDYADEDVRRRVKVGLHVFVIQPERSGTVSVDLEIHDAEPPYDADEWDHIAEGSLHLPTGRLQIHECMGGAVADFQLKPGWYRVRSFHGGLDTIDESGLEGDDRYRAVLWLSSSGDVSVLKQFKEDGSG